MEAARLGATGQANEGSKLVTGVGVVVDEIRRAELLKAKTQPAGCVTSYIQHSLRLSSTYGQLGKITLLLSLLLCRMNLIHTPHTTCIIHVVHVYRYTVMYT